MAFAALLGVAAVSGAVGGWVGAKNNNGVSYPYQARISRGGKLPALPEGAEALPVLGSSSSQPNCDTYEGVGAEGHPAGPPLFGLPKEICCDFLSHTGAQAAVYNEADQSCTPYHVVFGFPPSPGSTLMFGGGW